MSCRTDNPLKIGDTLPVAGRIIVREDGIDVSDMIDFSLWAIECNVKRKNDPDQPPYAYDLDMELLAGGVYADTVPSSETSTWVPGAVYTIDVRIRDENGWVSSTPTIEIKAVAANSETP